tara:strand:- start:947 stop:2416 length:1470 start_codon:yes stop_codon:yes gene_type:complete
MKPEDVAREHQFREGFRLVDFAEVGLPIFRLTIEAVTTSIRSLPTIHEFTMRCLALGESQEDNVSRMLGLKEEIVRAAVDTLVSDGLVARTKVIGDQSTFALTPLGHERLTEEAHEVVQEEMLVIDYDAMRRKPIRLAGENVVRAAELKDFGAVEIRPYPVDPPNVSELAIPEISRAIRRRDGEDFRRNVLALKQIVRRNNVFREAVALVYAAEKGGEVQVAFSIEGKLSDSHERAFAENGGPRKMGFIKTIGARSARSGLQRLIGRDSFSAMPVADITRKAHKEDADSRSEVRAAELAVNNNRAGSTRTLADSALVKAKERFAIAKHALDTMPIRPLACFEIDELVEEAINEARKSLVITSAGFQPTILTQHDLRLLDRLVGSGTRVHIGSFLKPQSEPRGGAYYDPLAELTKRHVAGKIKLYQTRRSPFFYLIKDEELAVISNRPMLGDVVRRSGFQKVEGVVTRDRRRVIEIREFAAKACGLKSGE